MLTLIQHILNPHNQSQILTHRLILPIHFCLVQVRIQAIPWSLNHCWEWRIIKSWSRAMVLALTAKKKIGFVNGKIAKPNIDSPFMKIGKAVTQWCFLGWSTPCMLMFQVASCIMRLQERYGLSCSMFFLREMVQRFTICNKKFPIYISESVVSNWVLLQIQEALGSIASLWTITSLYLWSNEDSKCCTWEGLCHEVLDGVQWEFWDCEESNSHVWAISISKQGVCFGSPRRVS